MKNTAKTKTDETKTRTGPRQKENHHKTATRLDVNKDQKNTPHRQNHDKKRRQPED